MNFNVDDDISKLMKEVRVQDIKENKIDCPVCKSKLRYSSLRKISFCPKCLVEYQ